MDYKEKYNKLVESIKVLQESNPSDDVIRNWVNDNVPELSESEDERIRKELIDAIQGLWDNDALPMPLSVKRKDEWISWLVKQGEQKPADKVEPKFHEGDWIISNNKKSTYQVIKVKRGIYVIRDNEDNHEYHIGIEECEKSGRIWTIEDAKPGDVLATSLSIFIFKRICLVNKPEAYCAVMDGSFMEYSEGCWTNNQCYPATKEQRKLLFEKMAEVGYEWDAKKKELKKIEFNPDDLIEESYQQQADDLIDMVTEKSAWSEEDEDVYHLIKDKFVKSVIVSSEENARVLDWFKSIKSRVQSQQKYKWTEEDRKGLENALLAIKLAKGNVIVPDDIRKIWNAEDWLRELTVRFE